MICLTVTFFDCISGLALFDAIFSGPTMDDIQAEVQLKVDGGENLIAKTPYYDDLNERLILPQ